MLDAPLISKARPAVTKMIEITMKFCGKLRNSTIHRTMKDPISLNNSVLHQLTVHLPASSIRQRPFRFGAGVLVMTQIVPIAGVVVATQTS